MLTVPQAAARVSRNPETIRRWIRSGRLRAQRIGTQHVIEEDDLATAVSEDRLPVPAGWTMTFYGEPMPDVIAAVRASRTSR